MMETVYMLLLGTLGVVLSGGVFGISYKYAAERGETLGYWFDLWASLVTAIFGAFLLIGSLHVFVSAILNH